MIDQATALDREIAKRVRFLQAVRNGKIKQAPELKELLPQGSSYAYYNLFEESSPEFQAYLEENDLVAYNPSLVRLGRKTFASFRITNKDNDRKLLVNGEEVFSTSFLFMGELKKDQGSGRYQLTSFFKLEPKKASIPQSHRQAYLFEDIRLFTLGEKLYAIGAWNHPAGHPKDCFQMVGSIDLETRTLNFEKLLTKPVPTDPEKNWIPIGVKQRGTSLDELLLQYSPTDYLQGDTLFSLEKKRYSGSIHNRTQQLPQGKDFTFSLVGTTSLLPELPAKPTPFNISFSKRDYRSHFALYNREHRLVSLSKAFKLSKASWCEFPGGLLEAKGELLISVGVDDKESWLLQLSKKDALSLLEAYEDDETNLGVL